MNPDQPSALARVREAVFERRLTAAEFREALGAVSTRDRDVWVNALFGCEDIPDDGPDLPRGCVPYLPCSVDTLLSLVERLELHERDVFVDVGAGVGRAALFVHLASGAGAMGIEIQSQLVDTAWSLASNLAVERFGFIRGDAVALTGYLMVGTVFFLYCPFSGQRLEQLLDELEAVALTRRIRICAVDMSLPPRPWLTPLFGFGSVQVFESTLHPKWSRAAGVHLGAACRVSER